MQSMKSLMRNMPQQGRVDWIGVRPERRGTISVVERVVATADTGLDGDHYQGRSGKRQVTLIQAEHIDAVASIMSDGPDPRKLRRNIVVRGLNLLALKGRQFYVGEALLEYTGLCQPCSLMEQTLGPGGYNAVRGHGGITARVLDGGSITVGDAVTAIDAQAERPGAGE